MHAAKQGRIGGELDRSRPPGYCERKRRPECDRYYETGSLSCFIVLVCAVVDCTFVRLVVAPMQAC